MSARKDAMDQLWRRVHADALADFCRLVEDIIDANPEGGTGDLLKKLQCMRDVARFEADQGTEPCGDRSSPTR